MLTDAECKNATCPADKARARLACSGGLYLEIGANGSKRWFWKYRKDGKEGRMALGSYPDVGAKAARKARDDAKALKADGRDPVQARKIAKLKESALGTDSFKETALEWFDKHQTRWSSHYAIREKRNLEKDLFPYFATRRIGEIEPIELLAAIRKVEERGALDVAHRVLTTARAVWRYGVATARAPRDITGDIAGALTPHHGKHFAAITKPGELGALIRVIRGYQGGPIVRAALQLAPMLFQRPGELRAAAWAEIDLDAALWTIPSARMKRKKEGKENGIPHLVPLPTQAVEILRKLQPYTGNLGLRPRRGGTHETPVRLEQATRRNAAIREIYDAMPATSKTGRGEQTAQLLRSLPDPRVTEGEVFGYVMRLHEEFGGTLPKSMRQVLRVVDGDTVANRKK